MPGPHRSRWQQRRVRRAHRLNCPSRYGKPFAPLVPRLASLQQVVRWRWRHRAGRTPRAHQLQRHQRQRHQRQRCQRRQRCRCRRKCAQWRRQHRRHRRRPALTRCSNLLRARARPLRCLLLVTAAAMAAAALVLAIQAPAQRCIPVHCDVWAERAFPRKLPPPQKK